MTYPSQPGYPAQQYGQPQPPQQQNNLWLIGGAILVVLIIIMTVILLVVQRTAGSSTSGDGGTTEDPTGDTDTSEIEASEFKSEACDQIDVSAFEEAVGESVDPSSTSHSESSYDSFDAISCYFYTSETYTSLNVNLYDYETADEVLNYVGYDEDSYAGDADYEFSEYTAFGDAGTLRTNISDPSFQTTYLHVALGSIEAQLSVMYDSADIDAEALIPALEDVLKQCDAIFADYK